MSACGDGPSPSKVGDEQFAITTRTGSDWSDDEYRAFYQSSVQSVGRMRSDVVLSIALGDKGSTITQFVVHGAQGGEFERLFVTSNLASVPTLVEAVVSGKRVLRSHGASAIAVCTAVDTLYLAEALEEQQMSAIVAQLPC